ncbi:hypothetical protein O0I10_009642 [Lichtheimia ornata]|uniref:Centromere protein Chl4/mis15/CENP-N n=1 Tax=Lichtheimia ornata TaxID=688661 RepID=A0AAD7UXJ2_9FUNG|nr:uncharacterized protein O0I10_009642 [Lichtheimia ornata]KAJ8654751.1 hypothetical protein O0I10_009642 [Lichtheimia ornata]
MFLSEADLYRISYSERVETIIRQASKDDIIDCIKQWYQQEELRPTTQNWDANGFLGNQSKQRITERLWVDWPEGLTAYQLAHIDLKSALSKRASTVSWRLIELKDDSDNPGRLLKTLDAKTARNRIQEALSEYFKAHVMTMPDPKEPADWIRIMLFENRHDRQYPMPKMTAYYLRFPDTPYLAVRGALNKTVALFIEEALLKTFQAKSLKFHNISSKSIHHLSELLHNKESLGAFSRFRLDQVDSNPLDYSHKTLKRPQREEYVKSREQKRRIIPINRQLIESREDDASDTFGPQVVEGIRRLDIHLKKPPMFTVPEDAADKSENEKNLRVDLSFYGTNVMDGIKRMLIHGLIEPPIPYWMKQIVSQGINEVYVTKDDVLREDPFDDDEIGDEEP